MAEKKKKPADRRDEMIDASALETEQKWQSILTSVPDVIIDMDTFGTVRYLNHFWHIGSVNFLVGKPFSALLEDSWQQKFAMILQDIIQSKQERRIDFLPISYQTISKTATARIRPILEKNTVIGISIVLTDISERIHIQDQLKESEERFREVFEQHYDAIILLDPDSLSCLDVNTPAVELFGYQHHEIMNDFQIIFLNPEDFPAFKKVVNSNINNDFLINQLVFRRKTGEQIICGVKGKNIKLREKNVLYCSFRDIQEKIRIEEKEKKLQAKLIQANKMTSLGTMSSGIAHEINNPNNFIMANTQIFSEIWLDAQKILNTYYQENGDFSIAGQSYTEVKEVVPQLLQGIIEGGLRIKNIISHLKEFSRPTDSSSREKVSINDVINFSLSILNNQIKKQTDCFHLELTEDLPKILGNAQQIEQVIINLIQNALHALADRHFGICIKSFFDAQTTMVCISIKDEGVGIPKHLLERIMEPFFTTKKDVGGTGLGLYISYSIVKDHQGSMDILSEAGKGTEVILKFPALKIPDINNKGAYDAGDIS